MGDSSNNNSGGGCLQRLGLLFLMAVFAGVLVSVYFMAKPQDLSDIGGHGEETVDRDPPRDLAKVLAKSLENGHPLAIRESEINRWLAHSLKCEQSGMLARWVTLDGILVRLADGHAEIIQQRSVAGRPFTVSLFVQIHQSSDEKGRISKQILLHSGPFTESLPRPYRGGRYGTLVVPEGFMFFILPAYRQLAAACQEELRLAFEEMSEIRFEKNKLVLNPRPAESPDAPPR